VLGYHIKANQLQEHSISFQVQSTMASSSFIVIAIFLVLPVFHAVPISDEVTEERSQLEFGDKFQGDIILTPEQEEQFDKNSKSSRTGLRNARYRWPKNSAGQVVVPYTIQGSSGYCKKRLRIFPAVHSHIIYLNFSSGTKKRHS
jgi:hypothetical protein